MTTVLDKVKTAIETSTTGGELEAIVVTTLTNRELDKRCDKLVKAFDNLVILRNNYDKINKADTKLKQGDVIQEFFTEKRLQDIAGAKKKFDTMSAAISQAFNQGDFGLLDKALQGDVKDVVE